MILITDNTFPLKHSTSRSEELRAFIETGQCDILVDTGTIVDDVDYIELLNYINQYQYNILIFDASYNQLNEYNENIDGTQFNNAVEGYSYLLTRGTTFEVSQYKKYYHTTLDNFKKFDTLFSAKDDYSHYIRLCPGDGFSSLDELNDIIENVWFISTQPFITNKLMEYGRDNFIEVYGTTIVPDNFEVRRKPLNKGNLSICFHSENGTPYNDGYEYYKSLVHIFKKISSKGSVNWYFIGDASTIERDPNISYLPPMNRQKLGEFFSKNIDILIAPNVKDGITEFPRGIEAATHGVVLFTTDPHKSNNHFKFTYGMIDFIQGTNPLNSAVKINYLYKNRHTLRKMSHDIQNHCMIHFNYAKQQKKIVDYVMANSDLQQFRREVDKKYNTIHPPYPYINHVFCMSHTQSIKILENDFRNTVLRSIRSTRPITLSRYSQDEWVATLNIPNTRTNISDEEYEFASQYLHPILQHSPKYYIGISPESIADSTVFSHIIKQSTYFKMVNGEMFSQWSMDNNMEDFVDSIRDLNVIVVGPKYLTKLIDYFPNMTLVDTIDNYPMTHYELVKETLLNSILFCEDVMPVILYCTPFISKKLIDVIYHECTNIIQLDVGRALDPWCGVNSEPWHDPVTKMWQNI